MKLFVDPVYYTRVRSTIASQMRGGYYTPIAEARGTISPSQTLPNLDSAISDIRTLLNSLGYQQHFDYQPTDLIGWAIDLLHTAPVQPVTDNAQRRAYHAGYYAALKACYPGQIPIPIVEFWDADLRHWVGGQGHEAPCYARPG